MIIDMKRPEAWISATDTQLLKLAEEGENKGEREKECHQPLEIFPLVCIVQTTCVQRGFVM